MNNQKRGFSIILPTYNAASELALALRSLKKNSRLNNELIVVVDRLKSGGLSSEVLSVLRQEKIKPLINEKNLGPYGSWNRGARKAKRDWLCFVTDDQYFAPGWDEALMKFAERKRLLTGQLVEPGIIPVWKTNIKANFGYNPREFKEKAFIDFAAKNKVDGLAEGGFFIPMVIFRADFESLGGWPTRGEFGARNAPANDVAFVEKARKNGFEFKRALGSFSYHFQGSSWRRKKQAKGISAVIISRPEEEHIKNCLNSLRGIADEIIIVLDSKKKGNVFQEAKKRGAKIFYRPFDNYSAQKNFAISKARGEWILSIDADEVVSPQLKSEVKRAAKDLSYNGYYLPRENIIFGKKIKHAGWYPDYQLRFFVKGYGEFSGLIHERVKVRGGVGYLKAPLVHYNYRSVGGFLDRLNRYTTFEAEQLIEGGYKLKQEDFITRPVEEFLRRFFSLKGYKDGLHGLVLSLLMAFYTLVIYLKVWEKRGFEKKLISRATIKRLTVRFKKEVCYWWWTYLLEGEKNKLRDFYLRAKRKIFCHK